MGVMGCDRFNCQNIMCDRYSDEHGYICNDCFEELLCLGVTADVQLFMRTRKDKRFDKGDVYRKFDGIFPEGV